MGLLLKQSTAITLMIGPFLDDTDGKTAENGLTIEDTEVFLSKNGGALAAKNDATDCTNDSLGYYTCPLNATDTGTLGRLQLMVHESGALPVYHEFMVVTAHVYDSQCGTDYQQVDVIQIGSTTQTATDLKDFADTGYDPATHKVQGVVLTDTCTTNTDMITPATVNAQCDTALSDINLDHLMKTAVVNNADMTAEVADGTVLSNIMSATGDTSDYNLVTDALEELSNVVASNGTNIIAVDGKVDIIDGLIDALIISHSLANIADAIWDEVMDSNAPANLNSSREILNVVSAVLAGKSSGGGTNTIVFRDTGDTKNRISATVDADGNRTAVGTQDGT